MLRLSALASSEVLGVGGAHIVDDDVGGVIELGAKLDAEFWKDNPPEAVCCRRRSADRSGVDVGGSDPGLGLYADKLAKTDWNEGVMVAPVPAVEVIEDEVGDVAAGAGVDDATMGGEEEDEDDGGGGGGDDEDDVAATIAAIAAAARAAVCIPLPEEAAANGNMCGW